MFSNILFEFQDQDKAIEFAFIMQHEAVVEILRGE